MKKNKLLRAMELADEKYVAEADPEKSFGSIKKKNKTAERARKIRKWSILAACLAFAIVAVNLVLFIPYSTDPPSVSKYSDSEYYSIIEKLNVITYKKPDHKNTFEFLSDVSMKLFGGVVEEGAAEMPTNSAPTSGQYHETTDNQVNGVIEADRIKRSDKYIYYLCDYVLYVYSIEGENSELVGAYTIGGFDRGYATEWEFYLSGDCSTVTVVAPNYNTQYNTACVTLVSLDVTDPEHITEKGRFSVSGGHISTRVVDGKLLLMTNFRVILADEGVDFDNELSFIPSIDKGNGFEVLPMENIITPDTLTSARYTVVCKLDEATLAFEDSTALLSYSEEVYVSKDKIFATNGYRNTVAVEGGEKNSRMTDISAISYADTEMKYLGTVTLEGYVKDQYSLDEYEGILRVVTTTDSYIQRTTTYNIDGYEEEIVSVNSSDFATNANLYCVSLENYSVVASVEAFAPQGETVKSVRFDGTTAYVCTAVELKDPVFFFDLSDLNNITYTETGTIEGFSTSLVNFGNGYLLGIGRGSSWSNLKIEIYEEVGDQVVSVCAFELENTYYSEIYKSYYIDRENQLVGLGIETYAKNYNAYDEASRYLLIHFDGYDLHEIVNLPLYGMNNYKRATLVDGYFYMFSGEEFKVVNINNVQ